MLTCARQSGICMIKQAGNRINPKERITMENFEYAVTKAIQSVAEMLEISFEQAAKEALEEGPVGTAVAKLVCAMAE